jgi:hypothetical protein
MDDARFDALTRRFGQNGSRRALLKGLLGLGGVATAGAVLHDTEAARRGQSGPPTTGPAPTFPSTVFPPSPTATTAPRCPGIQSPCGSECCCPAGNTKCGPDCCPDGQAECCDNECCYGTCYGEELCCPTGQLVCNDVCLPPGGCCTDADCAGARCLNNSCVPYTPTNTPSPTATPTNTLVPPTNTATPTPTPVPPTNTATATPTNDACGGCPAGQICRDDGHCCVLLDNGTCAIPCSPANPCPASCFTCFLASNGATYCGDAPGSVIRCGDAQPCPLGQFCDIATICEPAC